MSEFHPHRLLALGLLWLFCVGGDLSFLFIEGTGSVISISILNGPREAIKANHKGGARQDKLLLTELRKFEKSEAARAIKEGEESLSAKIPSTAPAVTQRLGLINSLRSRNYPPRYSFFLFFLIALSLETECWRKIKPTS